MAFSYQSLKGKIFSTKKISLPLALLFLVLSYLIASRAIDTGSWWEYLGAVVALVLAIKTFVRSFYKKHN